MTKTVINSVRHRVAVVSSLVVLLTSVMTSLEAADAAASGSTVCPRAFASFGCNCTEPVETEGDAADPSLPTSLLVTCRGLESAATMITNLTDKPDLTTSLAVVGQTIEDVSDVTLRGLASRQLIKLHLDGVGIKNIEPGSFGRLTDLDKLTLANNRIRLLRPGTFQGLQRLTVLILSGNPLYAVDAGVFMYDDIPMISVLELDRCKITDFEPKALSGLDRLQILNLSNNRLDALPVLGDGLDVLSELDLSQNCIRSLESGTNGAAAMSTPGPDVLRLGGNLIERLTRTSTFAASPSVAGYRLTELVLSRNAIATIEVGSLSGCPRLNVLDLSSNRLSVLDSAVVPWSNMTRVVIDDNPWNCSVDQSASPCSVNAWMVTQSAVVVDSLSQITCASPPSVAGKAVFADHVLDVCRPSNSSVGRQPAALYVCLTILICLLLIVVAIVIVSKWRRRAQQYRSPSSGPTTSSTSGHSPSPFGLTSPFGGWRKSSGPKRSPSTGDGHDDAWSSNIGYRQMVDLGPGSDQVSADVNEL